MAWIGTITNNGNDLLAQWVAGKTLTITKAASGQGRVSEAALLAQSALVNEKQTASIVSSQSVEKGQRIKLQVTPQSTAGYSLNQFGVWAKLDDGEEKMIALFQTDTDIGIDIPSKTEMPDFVYTFYGLLAFSNQGTLTVHIDAAAVVTTETMGQAIAAAMKVHGEDEEAHKALFDKKASLGEDGKVDVSELPVNTPGGIAGLGTDGKMGTSQLPINQPGGIPGLDDEGKIEGNLLPVVGPQIVVTAPTGSTVTAKLGDKVYTATEQDGKWVFDVEGYGTYTITATKGSDQETVTVAVTVVQQYSIALYYFTCIVNATYRPGAVCTLEKGETVLTAEDTSGSYAFTVHEYGTWTLKAQDDLLRSEELVLTEDDDEGSRSANISYRIFGFAVNKSDTNPATRVTYTDDNADFTPAHMNFGTGQFDYGSWGSEWFVTGNKPLMLKNDGTVDYYLDPNDYTKREDGVTTSDVSNTNYAGNAMAQFPLCWMKQWEENGVMHTRVSDIQVDSTYKAYAHTRADGSIEPFFYWSMFGGSSISGKLRSLKGQAVAQSQTAETQIAQATANGELWYIHTWSRRNLIQTLLTLMGRNDNTQAVYGMGNCVSATSASGLIATGTAGTGQFWGDDAQGKQVKVFHVEQFWGNQWDRTAGLINNSGNGLYVKMTPEGGGYRVTDVNGYTKLNIVMSGTSGGYISQTVMTEFGRIPTVVSGSETTNECDGSWFNNSQLDYLIAGAGAGNAPGLGGAFTFAVDDAPSCASWTYGAGLSCDQPAA